MGRKTVDYLIYETTYYFYVRISLNSQTPFILQPTEYVMLDNGNIYIEECYEKYDGWTLEKVKPERDKLNKKYSELGLRNKKTYKRLTYLA